MIAASKYLCSPISSIREASRSHGIGAQSLLRKLMMGRTETSGMALSPSAFRRIDASSPVRPFGGLSGFPCPLVGTGKVTTL
jgi:hypothetical protein